MTCRVSLCALCCLLMACTAWAELPNVPAGPGDWPQWRGPNRDGISTDHNLLKEWPEGGPPIAWQIDNVGVGYSSVAVKAGRIYTQGDLDGVEHVICLDAANGKRLWAVQPEPVAQEQAKRLEREFAQTDANGDGKIEEGEALARFGTRFNDFDTQADVSPEEARELAEARTTHLFALLDADGDGKLSGAEGRQLGEDFTRADQEDKEADADALASRRTDEMLKLFDKDADGMISRDESRNTPVDQLVRRADQRDASGERDNQASRDEIEQYLSTRERGRDGILTRDELSAFLASRYPGADGEITREELKASFGGYRNGRGDGPRGTPTVDGERLYTIGGNGDLTCFDAATGRTIWYKSLVRDFGGGRPGWGYSESPLVVGDVLIATPGGKQGTVAALDKQTGNTIWQSSGTTQGAHYSSAVAAEIGGVKQIVQFARNSCFGVSLDSGELLWEYDGANNGTANVATPIVEGDYVFASSAYGTGGGLAKITTAGGKQSAEEVYFENRMANHHGGIVKVGDYMYGFGNGGLICMNYLTGEIAWKARSVSKGSLVAADGMLYLLGEKHQVALAEATPEEYREHGRFDIESFGLPSWAHPVVAGGRLYIRNQHRLTAYDVRAK
jgi:outer membrane protein assembly factor BamB/Ca2+-binding EF-hand superfamily protein